LEDDIAIISSNIGWAPQAAGSGIATTAWLTGMPSGNGVTSIASAYDVVQAAGTLLVYKFNATQGLATVYINGIAPWVGDVPRTDVDLQMNITDARGNVLRAVDPPDTTVIPSTSLVLPVDGTYYIWVAGTGLAGSYSNYGSMGQFFLNVEYPTAPDGQFAAGQRCVAVRAGWFDFLLVSCNKAADRIFRC
jgi:hypothetical protein